MSEANARVRPRTIDGAADYFQQLDPGTALTKTAIRRLIITGIVPHTKVGNKYLVTIEALEEWLKGGHQPKKEVGVS